MYTSFLVAVCLTMCCCVLCCYSGLLSGHLLATVLQKTHSLMSWYNAELLHMAHDIGNRLLPAFNTSTGMPFPRVCRFHSVSQHTDNECLQWTSLLVFVAHCCSVLLSQVIVDDAKFPKCSLHCDWMRLLWHAHWMSKLCVCVVC